AFLMQYFDWVIIDTPPVMAVTDASLVANLAHGVVFVVGSEMTSRRVAQRAVEQLEMGQARFLGAVLNRVDLEHNGYYYSRYYRSDYGGYYGPPGAAPIGRRQSINVGDAVARASRMSAGAARVATITAGKAARVVAAVGARLKVGQNFRIEKHL
ncbi:MAG TPA: hypothetical protein VIK60_17725, partial [Vicinamibacterales bacterium]